MRWHANHSSSTEDMQHPSDDIAWKDFNKINRVLLTICKNPFDVEVILGIQNAKDLVIGTTGKTKDNVNSRKDMNEICKRKELKLTHDELLKPSVHEGLCGISSFFRDIYAKNLRRSNLEVLKINITEILCALEKEYNHLATYILLNCVELRHYERIFEEQVLEAYPNLSVEAFDELKQENYASWLRDHVQSLRDERIPHWVRDLSQGPSRRVISWSIMFTRGYTFHTIEHGKHRNTFNYRECIKSSNYSD
ncbi:PREDICTED: uncharacterized protein LOC104807779 [Tarenaya hassleriana]|uniref:uncharacterized protein LOC104807779 n=1 Tax=Tarenaya hassleriana TaxID=28532 RepID=UPI00053C1246|nr:PREDICTED: uncharacterized protein LOC104807779 [Tarenaya hassleriana]